jgi:flagellar hook-associated protein 3 FlgL
MQYENFYVLGGNDATTIPFDMSADGQTLTYHHKFAGDSEATNIRMEYQYNTHKDATTGEVISEGGYTYTLIDKEGNPISGKTEDDAMNELLRAMREQGRMSLGYGNVVNRETLPDTYTGGMNMVTGLSSDALRTMSDSEAKSQIRKNMDTSCFGLNARVIKGVENYSSTFVDSDTGVQADRDLMYADLSYSLREMDDSMVRVSDTFRRIGITTTVLEHVESNLQTQQDSYQQEYTDHMGIPLEEAITKMYSDQFAYNADMQVGSKIMQNSLFDFVR